MILVGLFTLLGALPLISATCDQPDIPPNAMLIYKKGIIRGNNFLEDSEVIFVYSTSNGKDYFHSFCQKGNWTGPIPFNVTLCGEPTDPANQTLLEIHTDYVNPVEGTYYEGTRVYLRCELGNGHRIVHHPMICQAHGEWTQTARCEVTCPPLRLGEKDDPRDATYNTSLLTDELHSRKGYSVNTMASFRCVKLGDKFSSVICQSSGKWDQQTPMCDTACDEPDIPTNGSLHSISKFRYPNGKYPERAEAIFQYHTQNETAFHHGFCKDGKWTKLVTLNARCGDPPKLPNQTLQEIPLRTGDPVNGKYRDGTVAFYYPCELGSGSRIISVCQASGEWTHSRCEEIICPHHLGLEYGGINYNRSPLFSYASRVLGFFHGYPVNTLASFGCYIGYYIEGSSSAICQTSGKWSQPAPICTYAKVICPHLSLVDGKVTYNTSFLFTFGELPWTFVPGYRVNTSVSFSCDEYYRREGSSSAICQSSGKWSQQAPTCAATPCLKPTVENGYFTTRSIYPPPNDTFFSKYTSLYFHCNPGYTFSYTPKYTYANCLPNGSWEIPIPSCILQEV